MKRDQSAVGLTHEIKPHKIGMMIGVGMFVNSIVILVASSYTADFRWAIVVGLAVGLAWTGTFVAIDLADKHMPTIDV